MDSLSFKDSQNSLDALVCQVFLKQRIVLDDAQRMDVRAVEQMLLEQKLPEKPSRTILEVSDIVRNTLRQKEEHYETIKPYGELLMRAFSGWAHKIEVSELLPVEDQARLEEQKRTLLDYELDFFVLTQFRSQYVNRAKELALLAGIEKDARQKEKLYRQVILLAERKSLLTPEWKNDFTELQADAHMGLARIDVDHAKMHYASAIELLKNCNGTSNVERVFAKIGKCYYSLADLTADEPTQIRAGLEGIAAYRASAIHEFKILCLLPYDDRQKKMSYFVRSLQRISSGLLHIGRYIAREQKVPRDVLEAAGRLVRKLPSLPKSNYYETRSEIAYGVLNLAGKNIKHAYRLLWKYPFGCDDLEGRVKHNVLTQAQVAIAQSKIIGLSKGWRKKRLAYARQLLSFIQKTPDESLKSRVYRVKGELYATWSSLDQRNRTVYQVRSLRAYKAARHNDKDRILSGQIGTAYLRLGVLLENKDHSAISKVKQRLPSMKNTGIEKVVDACYTRAVKNLYASRALGDSAVENATKTAEAYLGLARQMRKRLVREQKFCDRVVIPDTSDLEAEALREEYSLSMEAIDTYRKQMLEYFKLARKEVTLAKERAEGMPDFMIFVRALDVKIEATARGGIIQKPEKGNTAEFFVQLYENADRVDFPDGLNKVRVVRYGRHGSTIERNYLFKVAGPLETEVLRSQSGNDDIKKPQVIAFIPYKNQTLIVLERMSYTTTFFNWMHHIPKKRRALERLGSAYAEYRLAELDKQKKRFFRHMFDQWILAINDIESGREKGKISGRVLMLNKPEEYLSYFRKSIEPRILVHSSGKTLQESGILWQIVVPELVKMKRGMARDLNQSNVFVDGTSCDYDVLSISHYNNDPACCLEPFGLSLQERLDFASYALRNYVKDMGHEQVLMDFYWTSLWEYVRMSAHYAKRSDDTHRYAGHSREEAAKMGKTGIVPITEREEKRLLRKYAERFDAYECALRELSHSAAQSSFFTGSQHEAWEYIADYMKDVVVVRKKGPFISTKEQIK